MVFPSIGFRGLLIPLIFLLPIVTGQADTWRPVDAQAIAPTKINEKPSTNYDLSKHSIIIEFIKEMKPNNQRKTEKEIADEKRKHEESSSGQREHFYIRKFFNHIWKLHTIREVTGTWVDAKDNGKNVSNAIIGKSGTFESHPYTRKNTDTPLEEVPFFFKFTDSRNPKKHAILQFGRGEQYYLHSLESKLIGGGIKAEVTVYEDDNPKDGKIRWCPFDLIFTFRNKRYADVLMFKYTSPDSDWNGLTYVLNMTSQECDINLYVSNVSFTVESSQVDFYIPLAIFCAVVGLYGNLRFTSRVKSNKQVYRPILLVGLYLTWFWDLLFGVFFGVIWGLKFAPVSSFTQTIIGFPLLVLAFSAIGKIILLPMTDKTREEVVSYTALTALALLSSFLVEAIIGGYAYLLYSLFFVPHIYVAFKERYEVDRVYVITTIIGKIVGVFYIKFNEDNILFIEKGSGWALLFIGSLLLQAGILIHLSKEPIKHNYHLTITSEQEKNEKCYVCLGALGAAPRPEGKPPGSASSQGHIAIDTQEENESEDERIPEGPVDIMHTPCRHRFHQSCLSRCLSKNLECPKCREDVPPLF